jgi:hypothetical protein
MKPLLAALLLLSAAFPATAAEDAPAANALTPKEIAEGWILLFDGATTFGWTTEGDVKAADGVLTLAGGDKPASVTSTSEFGDCDLNFEYRIDDGTGACGKVSWAGASGEGAPIGRKGTAAGWGRGVVRVAEGKASWTMTGPGADAEKQEKKDLPVATDQRSVIAFAANPQKKISLRNVKLRPLGEKSIFNGKNLEGWKEIPGKKSKFTVTEDGALNIKDGAGDIQTEGQWADFVLQLEIYSNGKSLNSGVFFRCLPGEFWSGYEAQVRNQWQGDDRSKPVDYGTGGLYNRQPARKVVSSDKEWFTMTVAAAGPHIAIWVNGYQTVDYTDKRPPKKSAREGTKTDAGPLSLQGHDPTTDLSFRNIRIAELPKAEK